VFVCLSESISPKLHVLSSFFVARSTSGGIAISGVLLGPDLQNILRQSYDYLSKMPKLRSTYDVRLIYKTSYEGRKSFLRYDSLAKL